MKHLTEEELIAYREGEPTQREAIAEHLTSCTACRAELDRIEAVLSALDNFPVPERGPEYGRAVWQQIAPRLPEKAGRGWRAWLEPRRWVAIGAMAAVVIAAFVAGRWTKKPEPGAPAASVAQVRQRVLVLAVGEHLGKSEMVLMELANAAPASSGQKEINISAEQKRAEDLLDANRLYRETAQHDGDAALASVSGRPRARADGRGAQPGRADSGEAGIIAKTHRGTWNFVQSSSGRPGTTRRSKGRELPRRQRRNRKARERNKA